MKRLLAALLITSMLFGSNGITYAAEAASAAVQETVVQDEENVTEEEDVSETVEAEENADDQDQETEVGGSESSDADEAEAEATKEQEGSEADEEEADAAESDSKESEAANEEAEDKAAEENAEDTAEENAEPTTEEPAAGTEEPAKTEEEAVFTAGELTFKGDDYTVTLAYDEAAKIPTDAKLEVEEIGKDDPRYDSYFEGAASAVDKSVTDARFFDITIWENGEEVHPQSHVRVNITYDDAIKVEDEAEVQAVHFEKEDEDPKVIEIETNDDTKVDEIEFDAPSFSVYGVLYTVDFQFEGFTFSMAGNSTILLSGLAQKLNFYGQSAIPKHSL